MVGTESGRWVPFFFGMERRCHGGGREPRHGPRRETAVACFSGVSQRSFSPPGVFVPAFSGTRLTAQARAAHACTTRERRRLPLRHAPPLPALPGRCAVAGTVPDEDTPPSGSCARAMASSGPRTRVVPCLPCVNGASVCRVPCLLRPVTPAGSQPPGSAGACLPPSPPHDRVACASSCVPDRLRPLPGWRAGASGD